MNEKRHEVLQKLWEKELGGVQECEFSTGCYLTSPAASRPSSGATKRGSTCCCRHQTVPNQNNIPCFSPHGNSSVFHPKEPSPSPGEREQLAQREQVALEAARRNSIFSPANKPQPRQSRVWLRLGSHGGPRAEQRCEFVQAKPF